MNHCCVQKHQTHQRTVIASVLLKAKESWLVDFSDKLLAGLQNITKQNLFHCTSYYKLDMILLARTLRISLKMSVISLFTAAESPCGSFFCMADIYRTSSWQTTWLSRGAPLTSGGAPQGTLMLARYKVRLVIYRFTVFPSSKSSVEYFSELFVMISCKCLQNFLLNKFIFLSLHLHCFSSI